MTCKPRFKSAFDCAIVLSCLTGLAGCGGENSPQPGAQAAPGTTGDTKPGATSSEAHSTASSSAASAKSKPPEQPKPVIFAASELAKVIDFTKLPKIAGTKLGSCGPAQLSAVAPGKVPVVAAFYLDAFTKLGWKPSGGPGQDPPTDDFAAATLLKDGHTVSLSVFKSGDKAESQIELISYGNFDTRALPRGDGAKLLYGSSTSTSYVTPNKVPDEAQRVLKALAADGWQSYEHLYSQGEKRDDQRVLLMRKRGYTLNVMIAIAPALNNQTSVQYSVEALSHELPTPPQAANVEFTDNRWELKCTVPGDFKTAAEFYRKTMPELGYKPLSSEEPRDTCWNLRFGTDDGDIVIVQAASKDGKTTRILITGISAAALAEMKQKEGEKPVPPEKQ